jgi:hypothetical protein
MKNSGPKGLGCSSRNPSKDFAYNSMLLLEQKNKLDREQNFGRISAEMYCYCQSRMLSAPFDFLDKPFPNSKKYCDDWWEEFKFI